MERNDAEILGCRIIFDRIINELTIRMKDLDVDRVEIAALRCAILYNPSKFLKKEVKYYKSNEIVRFQYEFRILISLLIRMPKFCNVLGK